MNEISSRYFKPSKDIPTQREYVNNVIGCGDIVVCEAKCYSPKMAIRVYCDGYYLNLEFKDLEYSIYNKNSRIRLHKDANKYVLIKQVLDFIDECCIYEPVEECDKEFLEPEKVYFKNTITTSDLYWTELEVHRNISYILENCW